jgi:hypothetical protein
MQCHEPHPGADTLAVVSELESRSGVSGACDLEVLGEDLLLREDLAATEHGQRQPDPQDQEMERALKLVTSTVGLRGPQVARSVHG